jgi:hypothetical protein
MPPTFGDPANPLHKVVSLGYIREGPFILELARNFFPRRAVDNSFVT